MWYNSDACVQDSWIMWYSSDACVQDGRIMWYSSDTRVQDSWIMWYNSVCLCARQLDVVHVCVHIVVQ